MYQTSCNFTWKKAQSFLVEMGGYQMRTAQALPWRDEGRDGWMASLTQWTWVWASSRSWWPTGKPGVLQSMRLQSRTWLSDWTDGGRVIWNQRDSCDSRRGWLGLTTLAEHWGSRHISEAWVCDLRIPVRPGQLAIVFHVHQMPLADKTLHKRIQNLCYDQISPWLSILERIHGFKINKWFKHNYSRTDYILQAR